MWNLSLYAVTWNVGEKYPYFITLNDLLDVHSTSKHEHLPDIYIVGLQEVSARPQNIITNLFKSDPWVQKLKELLHPHGYLVAKTEQMQGLLLTIFVKKKHLYHIREIESEYTRTGLGGMWGNKGGVVIRMTLYGCSVCIVNSHLAAHDEMVDERISDYLRIKEATTFSVKQTPNIYDHDYVFWMGDLNFRLYNEDSSNLSPEEIRNMVKKDQISELLKKDQLMLIMCEGRAFSELVERVPGFPPTFKFEVGTNDYDMKRRPAWCDRILYKAKHKVLKNCSLQLEQIGYKSHPSYMISDHKPVSSAFQIQAPEDDVSNMVVKFKPFTIWNNSEDNEVEYILPPNFVDGSADWIGIYPEDYSGFDEYLGYEYTETHGDKAYSTARTVKIEFSASIDLPLKGKFVFLYFQSTGLRGYSSMLGTSDPFTVVKRCPTPRPDDID
ncbi:CLUMA_CG004523, isoform A [Clunio marinus]|uniref:CLUMA_CG004523, isoform A n=1 Tax=Clunio marinus TaxID=568069 RepID=A0A1J1HXG7_9DIPT|nr:CLUMA_CG004523, isoform A [Clunio marinus]